MRRSCWKVPFIAQCFLSQQFIKKPYYTTKIRNSTLSKIFSDKTFRVYNGAKFISITITDGMCGKKLGEFSISKILGREIALSKALKKRLKKKKK